MTCLCGPSNAYLTAPLRRWLGSTIKTSAPMTPFTLLPPAPGTSP